LRSDYPDRFFEGHLRLSSLARVEVNVRVLGGLLILLLSLASASAQDGSPFRIEIDLQEQAAFLIRGRGILLESPISSGRYGHLTQTGSFKVLEKEVNHYSSIYGKIVDANGKTIVADADVDMKVSRGGKFVPAPMRYFMRFHEADGMHAGFLPGYAASHGCVRMPEQLAIAFYRAVGIGTPVTVFGRTPRTNEYNPYGWPRQRQVQPWFGRPIDPRFQPAYDPRYLDPWWR
jgi:L,D-transpeptidase-like protein